MKFREPGDIPEEAKKIKEFIIPQEEYKKKRKPKSYYKRKEQDVAKKSEGFLLSKREIIKEAQDPAKRTAESLFKIIQFLFYRVPPKNKLRYLSRIRGKIVKIPPGQLAIKKTPPAAAIGQSIAISKNLLSGLNPTFVAKVLEELVRLLSVGHI
jgi:hypothetical protein